MKTLNRTLSLVLVLVMVLGFFGVAGAAFKDQADVKYDEAVEVMAGVGAINGYADGTFLPKGAVTREEAAKLVVYSILGKNVADKLSVSATGFKDVAADRWSAPYISYLVGKGVINGMGDGTFAPTANVTGYQMAKMMLVAAGYGAKGEFTGSGWELAVAVAGNKTKVFAGASGVDYTKPATREEATLYAFNGMVNVPQVEYNKVFDSYLGKGTGIAGGVGPTIASEVYGANLVTRPGNVDGVDGYYWVYKGQVISSFVDDTTVLATSTDGTTISALTTSSNSKYIGYQSNTYVAYYVNGVQQDGASTTAGKLNTDYTVAEVVSAATTNVKGTVVKFIDTGIDSKYDVISVTNATVYTLTGDATTKTSGAVTTVSIPGLAISNVDVTNVSGYEGLKKGDVVLHHSYSGKHVITKCDSFTGMVNGVNVSGNSVVVNLKPYYVSGLSGRTATSDYSTIAAIANATFYTDKGGNLVAFSAPETVNSLENTAYVLDAAKPGFIAQALLLKADGTTELVTVAKTAKFGGTLTAVTGTTATGAGSSIADGDLVKNNFYTFSKNTDGTYNLTVAKTNKVNTTTSTKLITKGVPVMAAGAVATNGTVFVYYSATGTKVYTGIANAPDYTTGASSSSVAYITDSNGLATFVVGVGGTYSAAVSADTKYVFSYAPATTIYPDATTSYYQIKAVVNGEITTIDMKTDLLSAKMGSLEAATTFENGRATALAADFTTTLIADLNGVTSGHALANIDDFTVAGTSLIAKNNGTAIGSFVLNADAKVFKYNGYTATTPIEEITLAELNALTGGEYTLQAVKTSSTDSSLKAVFVTVDANTDSSIKATIATKATPATLLTWTTASATTATATDTYTAAAGAAGAKYLLTLVADANATVTYTVSGGASTAYTGAIELTAAAAGSNVPVVVTVTPASGAAVNYTFTLATSA